MGWEICSRGGVREGPSLHLDDEEMIVVHQKPIGLVPLGRTGPYLPAIVDGLENSGTRENVTEVSKRQILGNSLLAIIPGLFVSGI